MHKPILIAATAAFLAVPSFSSSVLAAPPEAAAADSGARHPRFSAEDFAAFTDARIAALKAGLELTPAQEKNWPALETALREQAKARAERMAEWRDKSHEMQEHRSVIEGLERGSKRLAARSEALGKLADAAKPLYDSLDEAQKRRFGPLLHIAVGRHWRHGQEGFRHG